MCVVGANRDWATMKEIHVAQQADRTGERTIGVLTKLDIMDRGTDAGRMLSNEEIPLRLGYVGVLLRNQ